MNRSSPSKRHVSEVDSLASDDSEQQSYHQQPRLNESNRSPISISKRDSSLELIQSPLMKRYMTRHPDARRRFEGGDVDDCRFSADVMATPTTMTRRELPFTGDGDSNNSNIIVKLSKPLQSTTLNNDSLNRPRHRRSSELVKSAPRRTTMRFMSSESSQVMLTTPLSALSSSSLSITAELNKALNSDSDEQQVVDALTSISTLAYRDHGLAVDDIVKQHACTQLLFFGHGAYTHSGLVLIASMMRDAKWRSSWHVQQAALVAIVCGIKLTFDCRPDDLTETINGGDELRYPLGRTRRNVLEADTLSLVRSVVEAIEAALQEKESSMILDLVYTGLGALWYLASCPFRRKSCIWLLLWQDTGLPVVFEAMQCFPDERHVQELGKAIVTLALRADKCKTIEVGLDWNLRSIL